MKKFILIIFFTSCYITATDAATKSELEKVKDLVKLKSLQGSFGSKTLSLASAGAAYLGYKGLRTALNPWPTYAKFIELTKPGAFLSIRKGLELRPGEGLLSYFSREWATANRLRRHLKRVHGHVTKGIRVGGAAVGAFYLTIASSLWKRAQEIRELQKEFSPPQESEK